MYWKDTYEFLNSNDIEYKWEGKYGAKGEKRQKKKKDGFIVTICYM